jgi:hypothetical protein
MSRQIVAHALGDHMTSQVWTGNYAPVFPFTPQDFSVGALLPAILYMLRWGHRRGTGGFAKAFGGPSDKPTIRSVTERLRKDARFDGFADEIGSSVLGDLLLTSVLENRRHKEGHTEQVQRVFAAHYLASWIDLPRAVANLRGVPEMIVAVLADQTEGESVTPFLHKGRYPIGCRVEENALIQLFAAGLKTEGEYRSSTTSDRFDESAEVSLEQLLTIRLAQLCGVAPGKASGRGNPSAIPNQRPLAARATREFREDLLTFLECYGTAPRQSFLAMFEAGLSIGLTTILLSTVPLVEFWSEHGRIPEAESQRPWPIFADCSGSADAVLRDFSERSVELARSRLAELPTILMYMRLLDYYVSTDPAFRKADKPSRCPKGEDWLNLLGDLALGSHPESKDCERQFGRQCEALASSIKEEDADDPRVARLRNVADNRKYGFILAEVLHESMGSEPRQRIGTLFTSCLMLDQPNGLAKRRRVTLRYARQGRKTGEATSFILSNTSLEYLVHRHLHRTGKGRKQRDLSLPQFLDILRYRYGIHVDCSPPDLSIPSEVLLRNRRILERRLRDLGLLIGVNDAESMKKLRPRYVPHNRSYEADGSEEPLS